MDESEAPSFPPPCPASYIHDHNKNQVTYVKPLTISAFVQTRPDSVVEDQQRHQSVDEKSAPMLTRVRPTKPSYHDEADEDGDGVKAVVI
ncbi:hypothetical protein Tco_0068887 [Tanacetum coccineum]